MVFLVEDLDTVKNSVELPVDKMQMLKKSVQVVMSSCLLLMSQFLTLIGTMTA